MSQMRTSSEMVDAKTTADEFVDAETVPSQATTKSFIIDQELNGHGMGRYQWLIWMVCGTGYGLDIMWAQAFGVAWASIQREIGFSDKEFGKIASAFAAGIATGGLTWGVLIDIVGRRVAFLGTSLVAGAFGLCLGTLSSYNALVAIFALTAFGVGGNIPIDSTITVEYLPENRFYLLAALSIFQPLGAVICNLLAFWYMPNYSCSTDLVSCQLTGGVTPCCSKDINMGWRYLYFTISAISLGVFIIRFFIFPFHESPKFLLSRGDDKGAVEVVQKIAAFNRRSCDLTVESLRERCKETPVVEERGLSKRISKEISRVKLLFQSWRMVRVTILIWITWMFYYLGVGVAVAYLPTILQLKNSAANVSLKQSYVDYLIIYPPGLVAVTISVLMVRAPMVGRKWTLVFSSMAMGISLFIYSIVNTEGGHIGFNILEYFAQSLFNSALYGWTPEAFPAAVRGTATGLAAFLGNLVSISISTSVAALFSQPNGTNAVLYLAGSSLFVCTICLICLPIKDMVAPR